MNKKELVERYGSPLYVAEENILASRFRELKSSLEKHYSNFEIAYAYKANSLLEICRIFNRLGAVAEVVGDFEYDLARRVSKNQRIILSGPYKPRLPEALRRGNCIVNLDNFSEIECLRDKEYRSDVLFGIRINVDTKSLPKNHFGFSIRDSSFERAIREINKKNIKISGVHIHIGTNISDIRYYDDLLSHIQHSIKILSRNKVNVEFIDIGGGFPSRESWPINFEKREWNPPQIEEIIRKISQKIRNIFGKSQLPLLILEPGRYLVDDAVSLLSTVVAKKTVFGAKSLVLDAGVGIFPINRNYDLADSGSKELFDIYGPTCMAQDIVATSQKLRERDVGEITEFRGCGAYGDSLSMQFSFYRPAHVLITRTGEAKLIKKREKIKDVLRI